MDPRADRSEVRPADRVTRHLRRLLAKLDNWVTIAQALSLSQTRLGVEVTRHSLVPRII